MIYYVKGTAVDRILVMGGRVWGNAKDSLVLWFVLGLLSNLYLWTVTFTSVSQFPPLFWLDRTAGAVYFPFIPWWKVRASWCQVFSYPQVRWALIDL